MWHEEDEERAELQQQLAEAKSVIQRWQRSWITPMTHSSSRQV